MRCGRGGFIQNAGLKISRIGSDLSRYRDRLIVADIISCADKVLKRDGGQSRKPI